MAEAILALAERLKKHSRNITKREGRTPLAGDLRMAAFHLRRYACLLIKDALQTEEDTARRIQLTKQAILWHGGSHAGN